MAADATSGDATHLEVWGDPIEHSLSPALHAAAYSALGLDWTYGRRRVDESEFDAALSGLTARVRGLSCTMPLKAAALRAAAKLDRPARLTGAVNTLLLGGSDGPSGFNTDVGGLVRALREQGVDEAPRVRIVGAGATASSALVAAAGLGARQVEIVARRPERALRLVPLGEALGVGVEAVPLAAEDVAERASVAVTIGTLPGGTDIESAVADQLVARGGVVFDVAYAPWPSALACAGERLERAVASGLAMLVHQALLQVRIFVGGDPDRELADEAQVLAAMRSAVMED